MKEQWLKKFKKYEGLSLAEIARREDMTRQNVWQWLHKCKAELKENKFYLRYF